MFFYFIFRAKFIEQGNDGLWELNWKGVDWTIITEQKYKLIPKTPRNKKKQKKKIENKEIIF